MKATICSSNLINVYEVHLLTKTLALLTQKDVNMFLNLFCNDMPDLLLNNMTINPTKVSYNSEKYHDAVNNTNILYSFS